MKFEMRKSVLNLSLAAGMAIAVSGCGGGGGSSDSGVSNENKLAVLEAYADGVQTTMASAVTDAKALESAITAFTVTPNATTLAAAKSAWLSARESYGVTEIYRLSEGPIDGEEGWVATAYGALEGQINAWPLDENMIDYTTEADGNISSGNIIDTAGTFTPTGGSAVDVTTITEAALGELNENGGDANVATGYHAIEFLLWGQDQDYNSFLSDTVTNGAMTAGERPLEDYTSNANAQRRKDYLNAAAALLVEDLEAVASAWASETSSDCDTNATGCYRAALLGELTGDDAAKNIGTNTALRNIMIGMGTFIKSELANERIAVAVLTPSEEDEHSCFSDNTHRDIALNYKGFVDVLKGSGKTPSFYSLSPSETRGTIDTLIASIDTAVATVNTTATTTEHFDYQIMPGSDNRQLIKDMKNNMRDLGDLMVDVADAFGISLTEDDVTDPDETVVD